MSQKQGLEERNMARLNPVVALNRVPKNMTGWCKTVEVDSLGTMTVTCVTSSGYTVPHGLDGDVVFALLSAYEFQGRPTDGRVRVNMNNLCEYVGLKPSTNTYERIYDSLQCLLNTLYHAESCWGNERNGKWEWRSLSFRIINSLGFKNTGETKQEARAFGESNSDVVIQLGDEIIQSVQMEHTRWVDLATYHRLSFPLVRLLYRLLEEQQAISSGKTFRVPVAALGQHLGLRELDPDGGIESKYNVPKTRVIRIDRVRRALEPAHKELLEMGYLRDVEYEGRGQKQEVIYTFGTNVQITADVETVALLTKHGVTAVRAAELVRAHGRERIEEVSAQFEARLAGGYRPKNKAGLLCNMLEQPERYAVPEVSKPEGSKRVKSKPVAEEQPAPVERDEKMAEMLLKRCALHDTAEGKELLAKLVAAYVSGKINTGNLIDLASLNSQAARARSEELLRAS